MWWLLCCINGCFFKVNLHRFSPWFVRIRERTYKIITFLSRNSTPFLFLHVYIDYMNDGVHVSWNLSGVYMYSRKLTVTVNKWMSIWAYFKMEHDMELFSCKGWALTIWLFRLMSFPPVRICVRLPHQILHRER